MKIKIILLLFLLFTAMTGIFAQKVQGYVYELDEDNEKQPLPGARIEYKIDERVQELIDRVCARPYDDSYARKEWGWTHRYDLPEIVGSFVE